MEISHIRYFLALAEAHNFSRAAALCGVSQPALTRALMRLEEELGGPLFKRQRNKNGLTPLGLSVEPHMRAALEEHDAVLRRAAEFHTAMPNTVRVGVMCTISPAHLVDFFSQARRRMPASQMTLTEGSSNKLVNMLISGELDAAIVASPEAFPETVEAHKLYRERFVVGFPPGHRFERMNVVHLRDMAGEDYLSRTDCEFRDHLTKMLEVRNVDVNVRYSSPREDWIQNLIMSGMGCSLMPEYSATAPGLPTRLLVDPEVTREICIVSSTAETQSPAVETFVQLADRYNWQSAA